MIKLFSYSQILKKDEKLVVVRGGTVNWVDGKPLTLCTNTFRIIANVQPIQGRDLLMVPEADRFKEQYYLFLNNDQLPTDMGLEVQAKPKLLASKDRVTRLGVNFEVQEVEDWGSYIKARIMRVDVGPNQTP